MNDHSGHYLKPARRCTTPGVVFSVAVETERTRHDTSSTYSRSVFKLAVATVTKKRRGKWSIPSVIETEYPDILHQWIRERADTRRRNYVICRVASEVLTLTKWWQYAESRNIRFADINEKSSVLHAGSKRCNGIVVRRCLLRGKPDIFDYVDASKRYVWLSGIQYSDSDEQALAESIGLKPECDLFSDTASKSGQLSTLDQAMLWSQFLCHLANWWSESATAPFGLTVGSLSMGILRTHIKPKTLSTHNDSYVHSLERRACYGGRKSVWYVGGIGNTPIEPIHRKSDTGQRTTPHMAGPIRLFDVRSMYPYLLSSRTFPCRYVGRIGRLSGAAAREIAAYYGIIAHCTIHTQSGEYPYRLENRVTFPRGYIQTVLTGPEIIAIKKPDVLISVSDGAQYIMGEPFKAAAQSLLDMRVIARQQRNAAWELFAKSVGNNLGGKLAQRRTIMKPRPDVYPPMQWGEWYSRNADTGEAIRYTARAGMVWEYVKEETGYGPYTPSFAYLTAYGRLMMRELRDLLPPYSVVSQDTDGIWVVGDNAIDVFRQNGCMGDSPGKVSIKEVSNNAIFLGPQHYWTDKGWTLSGFHNFTLDTDRMLVIDSYQFNPLIGGSRAAPTALIERQRQSILHLENPGGKISPEGWVFPRYIDPPSQT